MSKKAMLSRFLCQSRLLDFWWLFRSGFPLKQTVTILTYHRVNRPGEIGFFDPSVIDATPEQFDQQLLFLKKHFSVLTFKQLDQVIRGEETLAKPVVIITFDDGYRDNYTEAFPLLQKHGLRATVFLSTGYLDQRTIFWWEKVHYFLLKTSKTRVTLVDATGKEQLFLLTGESERWQAIKQILSLLKELPDDQRKAAMLHLDEQLAVVISQKLQNDFTLTWDQVREMAAAGIEFGSHTVNHPLVSRLSPEQLRFELQEAKSRIEQEIAQEVVAFCYPVGQNFAYNEACQAAVAQAGYRFATTVQYGTNTFSHLDCFGLNRINVNVEDSLEMFKATVSLSFLFKY